MKKIILILLVLLVSVATGQIRQSVLTVADTTSLFGVKVSPGMIISVTDIGKMYIVNAGFEPTDNMGDVFTDGSYDQVGADYVRSNIISVGSDREQYSDFSTAVSVASAGDVIELSSTTFTESGTINMPTGSTLKIYEGGSIAGTVTLVGDNTRLNAGDYQCFGSGVTITGTWIVPETKPEWFGMIGLADESDEFKKALAFCKLTDSKTLKLKNKDYYLEDDDHIIDFDLTLDGGGAQLHQTSTTDYSYVLRCSGSNSTYHLLTYAGYEKTYFVQVDDESSLLTDLDRGDMVKIVSKELYAGNYIGETKVVKEVVGNTIVFTEPLFDTYLVADSAKIQKPNTVSVHLKDFTIYGNGDPTTLGHMFGISLSFGKLSTVENVIVYGCSYASIECQNGYGNHIEIRSLTSDSYGLGYGIAVSHAETSGIYQVHSTWNRHAGTLGGGSTDGGIPWNWTFQNSVAYTMWTHGFDAHPGVGSGVYRNCTAYGGMMPTDSSYFQKEWLIGTTYAINDIVSYGGNLYRSAQNANTGNSPDAGANTWWTKYNSGTMGFNILTTFPVTITDCNVHNHYVGVMFQRTAGIDNSDKYGIVVNGLYCRNVLIALSANNVKFIGCKFDNITVYNDVWKDFTNGNNSLIRLQTDTLVDTYFGKFIGTNIGGIYADSLVVYGGEAEVSFAEINCQGYAMYQDKQVDTISYRFKDLTVKSNAVRAANLIDITGAGVKNIYIDNLTAIDMQGNLIITRQALTNFSINKAHLYCLSTGTKILITPTTTITNLYLGDIAAHNNKCELLVQTGTNITNLQIGKITGTYNAYPAVNGEPTNGIIYDGNFNDPLIKSKANSDSLYLDAFVRIPSGGLLSVGAPPLSNAVFRAFGRMQSDGNGSYVNALRLTGTNSGGNMDNGLFLKTRGSRAAGIIIMETNTHKQWYMGTTTASARPFIIAKKYVATDVFDSTMTSTTPYLSIDTTGTISVYKMKYETGVIADNDATPDMSGYNVFTYNGTANAVTITDFDNPIVGMIYTIIGNSDIYTVTIADSGNFNTSEAIVLGAGDIVSFRVVADNNYIQWGKLVNN